LRICILKFRGYVKVSPEFLGGFCYVDPGDLVFYGGRLLLGRPLNIMIPSRKYLQRPVPSKIFFFYPTEMMISDLPLTIRRVLESGSPPAIVRHEKRCSHPMELPTASKRIRDPLADLTKNPVFRSIFHSVADLSCSSFSSANRLLCSFIFLSSGCSRGLILLKPSIVLSQSSMLSSILPQSL
jgi:hypothetical protein